MGCYPAKHDDGSFDLPSPLVWVLRPASRGAGINRSGRRRPYSATASRAAVKPAVSGPEAIRATRHQPTASGRLPNNRVRSRRRREPSRLSARSVGRASRLRGTPMRALVRMGSSPGRDHFTIDSPVWPPGSVGPRHRDDVLPSGRVVRSRRRSARPSEDFASATPHGRPAKLPGVPNPDSRTEADTWPTRAKLPTLRTPTRTTWTATDRRGCELPHSIPGSERRSKPLTKFTSGGTTR